ncbi:MAG: FMN-binding negative transcriptional regulator [Planctomicrobium sp.]|mgnify:CR=1 FL=1|jgi:transcriptional regulator|nr:FMN-binding negative transcriptional regulator [Planctomicrobium sp.]
MYNPSSFQIDDPRVIRNFIADHPFAQLTSFDGQRPVVSHLPLLWKSSSTPHGQLIGHLAKANAQWKHAGGTEVLAVFTGPHAYISSSWYETPQTVPTWNYTAVHVHGQLELIEDKAELFEAVDELVTAMEGDQPNPWSMEKADSEFIEMLLDMIVGFRVNIESLECKFKLSQNHTEERRTPVIEALSKQLDDNSQQIASLMRGEKQGQCNESRIS